MEKDKLNLKEIYLLQIANMNGQNQRIKPVLCQKRRLCIPKDELSIKEIHFLDRIEE